MSAEKDESRSANQFGDPVIKYLLVAALSIGTGGAGLSVYRTQDRFYASDGVRLEERISAIHARLSAIENRIDNHIDPSRHPDRELRKEINALRVEMARHHHKDRP